ncbi:MAG: hypothetical protein GY835_22980, partial [bacterium]|nr:hypothetical protein [bacterium]
MENQDTNVDHERTESLAEALVPAPASVPEAAPPAAAVPPGITAAECTSCSGGGGGPSLVYALGQLDYDFGSEARRDSFLQHGISNPHDPEAMLKHLKDHPAHATALTWTLVQDATPIYAVMPAGPFAAEIYETLREFVAGQ